MSISTMEAATVKFDAEHWINSYFYGWKDALLDEASAMIADFVRSEENPEELKVAAGGVWEAVKDTHFASLMPYKRQSFGKPYDRSEEGWRVRFIREDKGLGIRPETRGLLLARSGYEEEQVTGWSSRRGTIHEPGVRYAETYVWVHPEHRRKGIADAAITATYDSFFSLRPELRSPFYIDPSNLAAARLIEKHNVQTPVPTE